MSKEPENNDEIFLNKLSLDEQTSEFIMTELAKLKATYRRGSVDSELNSEHSFYYQWLEGLCQNYPDDSRAEVRYPFGDEDIPLVPKSILTRFWNQSESIQEEIEEEFLKKNFHLLDRTCEHGRFILRKPVESDRDELIKLAQEQQEASALSFYDFYKSHKGKNDLPDTLPDTLLFDLMLFCEKKEGSYSSLDKIFKKHTEILETKINAAATLEEKEEYQEQLDSLNRAIPEIREVCEDNTQSIVPFKKLFDIEQRYSLPRDFNLEWMSERYREVPKGKRNYDNAEVYNEQVTNAYVYFDPHEKKQTIYLLVNEYMNANETSKEAGEQAHWLCLIDEKNNKVAGVFRYEGNAYDVGICSSKEYQKLGLIAAAITETGTMIYNTKVAEALTDHPIKNPEIEISTWHPTNSNSPKVLKKAGYVSIKDMPTIIENLHKHYYDEPRTLAERRIEDFYSSYSFIKRTFNYLEMITFFENSENEISKEDLGKLRELNKKLQEQTLRSLGEDHESFTELDNPENVKFLLSIANKIKTNHPDLAEDVYGLILANSMLHSHVHDPREIMKLMRKEDSIKDNSDQKQHLYLTDDSASQQFNHIAAQKQKLYEKANTQKDIGNFIDQQERLPQDESIAQKKQVKQDPRYYE